jgi:hypothetical protein
MTVIVRFEQKKLEERRMLERREVKRRRYKAHTYFPAINHRGNFIMSERRQRPTRRAYDIFVEDTDLPTMFLDSKKQM